MWRQSDHDEDVSFIIHVILYRIIYKNCFLNARNNVTTQVVPTLVKLGITRHVCLPFLLLFFLTNMLHEKFKILRHGQFYSWEIIANVVIVMSFEICAFLDTIWRLQYYVYYRHIKCVVFHSTNCLITRLGRLQYKFVLKKEILRYYLFKGMMV